MSTAQHDLLIAFARSIYLEEHEDDCVLPSEPEPSLCAIEGDKITLRDAEGSILVEYRFRSKRRSRSDREFHPVDGSPPFFIQAKAKRSQ